MRPILYDATETAFDTNGIGVLSDAIRCVVVEELNGQYELTLKYPLNGIHAEEIADRCFILVKPNPVSDPQPFRIYRVNPVSNGQITVYARHRAYDLMGIPVSPFSAPNAPAAMSALKNKAAVDCPFTFYTDKSTSATMAPRVPKSAWSLLGGSEGSVLDVYGGEYEFDNLDIRLLNRRGADRGVSIRYGKNLKTLEQDRNCANCYTGVYPYWAPNAGDAVELPEKILDAEGTFNYTKIYTLDLSQEWQEAPTEEQLRTRAQRYMEENNIGVPEVSWKIEYVSLEQTEEYKGMALLERVLLGDAVNAVFPKMNVNVSARVVKTQFDAILERYDNITLGRVKSNLADTIVQQGKDIASAPTKTAMELAIECATKWITNGKGYMVAVKDSDGNWREICSLDTPDIATAVNVWRWNNGGFGFSSNGYNGPYNIAITQDGKIVADFITTGTLNAAQVKVINLVADSIVSGKLTSKDGSVTIDLDNNTISATGVFKTIKTLYCGWQMQAVMAGYSFYLNGTDADGKTKSFVSLEADTRAGVGYFRNTATTNQGIVALIPSRVDGEPTTVQARTAAGTTEDGHILAELQSDDTMAALRLRRGTIRELLIKVDSDGWYMDGHKMKWGYVESLGGYVLMGS